MKREEQKISYTWRLEDMFESDEQWEKDYEKVSEALKKYPEYENKITENKEELITYLLFNDKVNNLVEKLYVYSNQKYHQDMSNAKYQAYAGKAQNLVISLSGEIGRAHV